jgi:hypothetical protein
VVAVTANEAVDGFNVTARAGWVAESLTSFLDGPIQSMIEIDEYIRLPEESPEFLARDDFSRTFPVATTEPGSAAVPA